MTKPVKKLSFKDLQAKWYKKLADKGFDDIEYNLRPDYKSLTKTGLRPEDTIAVIRESKEEYYRMAYHFLNEHEFDSRLEQIIWEYHAEGISVRDIAELLKKARVRKKLKKTQVWAIVSKLEAKMKLRYMVK